MLRPTFVKVWKQSACGNYRRPSTFMAMYVLGCMGVQSLKGDYSAKGEVRQELRQVGKAGSQTGRTAAAYLHL